MQKILYFVWVVQGSLPVHHIIRYILYVFSAQKSLSFFVRSVETTALGQHVFLPFLYIGEHIGRKMCLQVLLTFARKVFEVKITQSHIDKYHGANRVVPPGRARFWRNKFLRAGLIC